MQVSTFSLALLTLVCLVCPPNAPPLLVSGFSLQNLRVFEPNLNYGQASGDDESAAVTAPALQARPAATLIAGPIISPALLLGQLSASGQASEADEPRVIQAQAGGLVSQQPSNSQAADEQQQQQQQRDEIYILEDKDYPKSLYEHYPGVGQVTGITTLPSGDVAIFHRADREWNERTFNESSNILLAKQPQENLIKNDTIMIIDREDGSSVTTFGSGLFYMPHSIASDNKGNLWVSDVGRHQVMRLPTSMMQLDLAAAAAAKSSSQKNARWLPGNLTRLWPDIILGEAFVPGADQAHFCKPSEVAVSSDGRLVYVADGYCNRRIMVFTGAGRLVGSFGERQGFNVVHSLTLIEERNLICAADRENGRILCFRAGLDGDLGSLGELVLNVQYPLGRVFAIASLGANHMLVSSNQPGTGRYDLAALNPFTSELKQTWTSSDLLVPHSLACTRDGQYAYAADISKDAYKKVFKFDIIQRKP